MELKDIKAIIDLMRKNGLSEFELERSDFKIKLKRPMGAAVSPIPDEPLVPAFPAAQPQAPLTAPAASQLPAIPASAPAVEVKASPESADYVEIGTEVTADTVVCLIEAMKVMNEIKAEAKGVITHILVENAKPVEFGQPLFRLRPA